MEKLYEPGARGICPHCARETRFDHANTLLTNMGVDTRPFDKPFNLVILRSSRSDVFIRASRCTLCEGIVVWTSSTTEGGRSVDSRAVPPGSERPVSPEVPSAVADVFRRASRLVDADATAAAAFCRTCLEKVFDDRGVPRTWASGKGEEQLVGLTDRIKKFLEADDVLRPATRANIDYIRTMGNFIHLNRSIATGDPVEVTSEEAAWLLDVLQMVFEDLYVQPVLDEQMKARLQAKSKDVGER